MTSPTCVTAPGHTPEAMTRYSRTTATDRSSLLCALRGTGTQRLLVDPTLAGGLKEWLEDSLADLSRMIGDRSPALLVCPRHVRAALAVGRTEKGAVGSTEGEGARQGQERVGTRSVRADDGFFLEILVRCIFRQWITTGQVGNPMNDALYGLAALGGHARAVEAIRTMDPQRRRTLAEELSRHAQRIVAQWPELCPSWYPRTRERLTIPVCGGRVVLAGSVDLAVGFPASDRASTCLVEVTAGRGGPSRRADRHFYALLETLRAGAPPSRVATFESATGRLEAEQVDEHMLIGALLGTVEAAKLRAADRAGPTDRARPPGCGGDTGDPTVATLAKRSAA